MTKLHSFYGIPPSMHQYRNPRTDSMNGSANNYGVRNGNGRLELELLENIHEKNRSEGFTYVDRSLLEQNNNSKLNDDEDNYWHEIQLNRKMIIKKKIEEYVNTFTVHGLTKVFTGERVESAFWLVMLFGGILLSVVIVHGLVTKFLKHGIYTEIRSEITDENFFPSVTFCENQLLIDNYFSYCGVPPRVQHINHTVVCDYKMKYRQAPMNESRNKFWYNGLFNVTKCETWGGKKCANSDYFKTMKHFNHSCITWNYAGNLSDIYSHVDIEFEFKPPSWLNKDEVIIAVPHDHTIHEIDITNKVDIEPYKTYEIKLDKTEIKRLPHPFPSNCSNSKGEDIFPGRYTRRSCIESHNYIEMYKKCGDTLDYVRQFIPHAIKKRYKGNKTIKEAEMCIWRFGKGETQKTKNCAFPCTDLDLGVMPSFNERKKGKSQTKYRISLQYQRVDAYKVMEEKELYPWDQMACEIGGLIGLVIGASIISLVEIIAYVFLVIVNKFI
ncbi:acid-sensing ion channel 4-A-like isoform X2 [Clytia hemisphaerica]|uniref:acid-sensing ion channel 4-A-like isoform X2 n=1 Tax=Clytia hemisphaerica TaxID=252671 RepID=UPI0034D79BD7